TLARLGRQPRLHRARLGRGGGVRGRRATGARRAATSPGPGAGSGRGNAGSGQTMLIDPIDPTVTYDGPRAALATLSGSSIWGLGDGFASFAEGQGARLLGVYRPRT